MSARRGKRTRPRTESSAGGDGKAEGPPAREDASGRVPELLRRMVGMGFSGFFLTEEVVRKALGETLPKDWVDFAAAQSERTRRELTDRIAHEVRRTLDRVDLPQLAERLLRGHAIEVSARLRFIPRRDEPGASDLSSASDTATGRKLRVTVTEAPDEQEDEP